MDVTAPNALIDESLVRDVDLLSDALRQNWFEHSVEWSQSPPFFTLSQGYPQLVCGRYADAKEIFLKRDLFTTTVPQAPEHKRYDSFNGVQAVTHVDGEAHDRIRRLLQPTFGAAGLERFRAAAADEVDDLLDAIEAKGGGFDAVADWSSQLMPRILLGRLLGVAEERRGVFIRMIHAAALAMTVGPGEDFPAEYIDAFEEARRVTNEIIEERLHGDPGEDFVGSLLTARASGVEVSDDEIFANLFIIAAGGLGTTEATAATMLLTLCRNPGELEKLRASPELVPDGVEECLRYHPAGLFVFPRFATADTEVAGVRVPAGTVVWPCVTAANLDAAQFPDPLRLDVERRPAHTLTFGIGSHFCVGAVLARMTLATGLGRILERFPRLRLADPDFAPHYHGQPGELAAESLPMLVD